MKVKLLSDSTHETVIGRGVFKPSAREVMKMQENWSNSGLQDATDDTNFVELPLPEFAGHWRDMLDEATEKYGQPHIQRLAEMARWENREAINTSGCRPGWQASQDGKTWVSCSPPSGRVMVLDTETVGIDLWKPEGELDLTGAYRTWFPICCVCMLEKGWLVWLADIPAMMMGQRVSVIPFGKGNTVLGHNVSYDRQWLDCEYELEDTRNRFSDTMSQWVVTRGLSNQQRPVWRMFQGGFRPVWVDESSTNGLDEVYKFYYGEELDKGVRELLVNGGLSYVEHNMHTILQYCLNDVTSTHKVFKKLYPEYLQHRPSLISQVAALLLGSSFVPLSPERFPEYARNTEAYYQKLKLRIQKELLDVARAFKNKALETYPVPQEYYRNAQERDSIYKNWVNRMPEHWQWMDWNPALSGPTKGIPKWYRSIKPKAISLHQRFIPTILGCKWRDEFITWDGYQWVTLSDVPIPHPEDASKALKDVFIKGMSHAIDEGVLTADDEGLQDLLDRAMSTINWISMRKRVFAIHTEAPNGYPVCLPQISVNGTITGRAADKLWQVLPNPKEHRVGTELKSMVEVPEGWSAIGADVDSEELWMAASIGDAVLGYAGSTPLGLMTIIGDKKKKTDIHSKSGITVGIKREYAKNLVYGVIYGLGLKGAINTLSKNLPGSTEAELAIMAKTFLDNFKGIKYMRRYSSGWGADTFNQLEEQASAQQPVTPMLKNKLTKSLAGVEDFQTTKVNWMIQASGADFRDMLIVLQRYFYERLGIEGRLLLTIHDEIRTMVRKGQEQLAAYALQLVHLYCRASFTDALGLDGVPSAVAWFSGVDVDTVLRKEPVQQYDKSGNFDGNARCVTPTQTAPIPDGYILTPEDTLKWLHDGQHDIPFSF